MSVTKVTTEHEEDRRVADIELVVSLCAWICILTY